MHFGAFSWPLQAFEKSTNAAKKTVHERRPERRPEHRPGVTDYRPAQRPHRLATRPFSNLASTQHPPLVHHPLFTSVTSLSFTKPPSPLLPTSMASRWRSLCASAPGLTGQTQTAAPASSTRPACPSRHSCLLLGVHADCPQHPRTRPRSCPRCLPQLPWTRACMPAGAEGG